MLRISDLTKEELKVLIAKPMTPEEARTLIEINESDRWLLRHNLDSERQSDPRN